MGYAGDRTDITLPITGSIATPVSKGRILIADTSNAANAAVSTAGALGFVGVTLEKSDPNGYAAVRNGAIVQCVAGTGGVTSGNLIASDANGAGVPITPAGTGTPKQVVGVALSTVAAAGMFDLYIAPQIVLV